MLFRSRCQLSASLTRFSLLHHWPAGYRCVASSLPLTDALLPFTAGQPASGVLPAHYLSPTRFSLLHRWPAGYRCVASSLPLTEAILSLAPLARRLLVRCLLSTSLRCAFPFHTASYPATCSVPALYLSIALCFTLTRIHHANWYCLPVSVDWYFVE